MIGSVIAWVSAGLAFSDEERTEEYRPLFNGENFDGWYLKLKEKDVALAKRVFAIEDGTIHIFNDSFPDEYELDKKENKTHGMMFSKKKFSRFHLKFEYKWGKRIANNFSKWQYDAGVFYHVSDDAIWPVGIEYQIRYDHLKDKNHTGDLIRPKGQHYDWFCDKETKTFLSQEEGGVSPPVKMWYHLAVPTENHHALDGEWNICEIIAMGDDYAIHKLNGKVVNRLWKPNPREGVIGFQAETAEIFYRNIEIKEFAESVPAEQFLSSPEKENALSNEK